MNIYGLTVKKLEDYFCSIGENPAKAKIVFRAVYRDKINSFKEFENLGDAVKGKLGNDFNFYCASQYLVKVDNIDDMSFLDLYSFGDLVPGFIWQIPVSKNIFRMIICNRLNMIIILCFVSLVKSYHRNI